MINKLISVIAPHKCLICGTDGQLMCGACFIAELPTPPSCCYRCSSVSQNSRVCKKCSRSTVVKHLWVATYYESTAKSLVYKLKFERTKDAARILAKVINQTIPNLPENTLVCYVPTANNRVRARGYDQAELVVRLLAKERGWKQEKLLMRKGKTRQVGSSRKKRFDHLETALFTVNSQKINGTSILLIDDVLTTGATIEAAAKVLKKSGARTVNAAVFARVTD